MNFHLITIISSLCLLTACASVTQDKTQPIKVETLDKSGNKITGAKCELQNNRGAYNVETPNTVFVRKSASDMSITCTSDDKDLADGKLISRTGGAVFGNIILGGVIGAVVDTSSGVAYNYPEWVQLVFGQTLVFDRKNHNDAQPTKPTSPGESEQNNENSSKDLNQAAPEPKVEHITIVAPGTD